MSSSTTIRRCGTKTPRGSRLGHLRHTVALAKIATPAESCPRPARTEGEQSMCHPIARALAVLSPW
eukprot:6735957-Pyramimonas_sp.AAC.2